MSNIYKLTTDQIKQRWNEISPLIKMALDKSKCNDYIITDVYAYSTIGEWQIYVAEDNNKIHGAAVVNYHYYPHDVVAYIMAIGGRDITRQHKDLWQLFKEAGASRVQGACRPSVVKLFKSIGLLPKYTIIEGQL